VKLGYALAAVAAVGVVSACHGHSSVVTGNSSVSQDGVTITNCYRTSAGLADATVQINNQSKAVTDYHIMIAFKAGQREVGHVTATAFDVAPGESTGFPHLRSTKRVPQSVTCALSVNPHQHG
jgi:hypothetical protein